MIPESLKYSHWLSENIFGTCFVSFFRWDSFLCSGKVFSHFPVTLEKNLNGRPCFLGMESVGDVALHEIKGDPRDPQ